MSSERTDEYRQIETIFGQCVAGGMMEFDDGSVTWQTAMIDRLARPLEDANGEIQRLLKIEAVAKAAGLIKDAPDAAKEAAGRALIQRMSDISEGTWCAGWLNTLEFDLYRLCLEGGGEYGMGEVSKEDVEYLMALAELAGGWPAYRDGGSEPEIVPMEEWKAMFAKADQAGKDGDK